jgi:hypothetical protein
MRTSNLVLCLIVGSFSCGPLARGAEPSEPLWRLGLNYRLNLNADVSFRSRAGVAVTSDSSVTGRSYRDGFVGTDSSGNAMGLTTYWGYEDASQIAGGSLLLHHSQNGTLGEDDPAGNGFEMSLSRRIGQFRNLSWGMESAFGYSRLDASWSGPANSDLAGIDAFPLGGIIPPVPPYQGPKTVGPGSPLLETKANSVPFSRALGMDATIYAFRLGPFLEIPFGRFNIAISGGLALAQVDSFATVRETLPAPFSAAARSFEKSEHNLLWGGYASATLGMRIADGIETFTGAQFIAVDRFEQNLGDHRIDLDLGGTVNWVVGIAFRF